MRASRIRQRWKSGKPAVCIAVTIKDPCVCELVSLLGYDGIWLDFEHHSASIDTASDLMRAARVGGSDILARPAKGEFMRMGRLLEIGAQGILYPRCDDAAEAAEVVRWSKFAPLGERGFDGSSPDMPYYLSDPVEYIKKANEETFVAIQIETPEALKNTRSIAEVAGVDVIFFGPGDFSILSGNFGKTISKEALKARETAAKEALAAGKRFGSIFTTVEQARELLDIGATLLVHCSDICVLGQNYQQLRNDLEPFGVAFDSQL